MLKKTLIFITMLAVLSAFPGTVRITQIDTSGLLTAQKTGLYLGITDDSGNVVKNLSPEDFRVYESANGTSYVPVGGKLLLKPDVNREKGINFLILIDNSGSMYFDLKGNPATDESKMRMTYVRNAVKSFLDSFGSTPDDAQDRVGIASYNSDYTLYSAPAAKSADIYQLLDNIKKPSGDEGWTEIYSSLYLAIKDFSNLKGRKALLILSDGENMPYSLYTGKPQKVFGNRIFTWDEPVKYALGEGVTVYAINYGNPKEKKDSNLEKIASETGGMTFDAYNEDELKNVYSSIKSRISDEYYLEYNATMSHAVKKYVKVVMDTGDGKGPESVMYYFSSTIFGSPMKNFNPLVFAAFILACILLWLLTLIKFKNGRHDAALEVLSSTGRTSTKILTLNRGKTIIGGSNNADMTIFGNPEVRDRHATIIYDEAVKKFTVVSENPIRVNNKKVKTRVLEDGDVLNVSGTTIVFDEGMMKKKKI